MRMFKSFGGRLFVILFCTVAVAILGWLKMASRENNADHDGDHVPTSASAGEGLQKEHPADLDSAATPQAEESRHSTDLPFSTPGSHERTLPVDDRERSYLLHVPSNYNHEIPTPLVLVFHGRLGTGRLMERMTGFSNLADQGFIVAYPDGIGRSWNAGHGVGPAELTGVNDVGFISSLMDHLSRELNIDPHRIYAAGMSSGGMFTYRLACELKGRLAAVASVAGSLPSEVAARCHTAGISVLHIHGTADRIVPWDGGETSSGGSIVSVDATVRQWANAAKCSDAATVTLKEGNVECQSYSNCTDGTEVTLCSVAGGGHTWPGSEPSLLLEPAVGPTNQDVNATRMIWEFFSRHALVDINAK
jgi:polyhydroxybutyrate depolymerase